MSELTETQKRIFSFIKECEKNGVPPSVREICNATGLASTSSVHYNLKKLESMGLIRRGAGKKRTIVSSNYKKSQQVPILGTITAGNPIFAHEEILGYLPFENGGDKELFSLRVKGYSMKNAGILDGDYIFVHKGATVKNGDIVVALLEDEATVKTFYKEGEFVRLQPQNDDFEPIYSKTIAILGKVIGLTRNY